MSRRIVKQLIYSGFFLSLFFLIAIGIYFLAGGFSASCFDNKQNQSESGVDCGGPCVSCDVKYPKELDVLWSRHFPISNNRALIAVAVENLNTEVGSPNFSYQIDLFSKNGIIVKQINDNSFIYAGEKKYILEAVDISVNEIDKIETKITDVKWLDKVQFLKPKTEIREFKTEISAASTTIATANINGVVASSDVERLSKIVVLALLRDKYDVLVGISKIELEGLDPFEARNFKIIFPSSIVSHSINPSATEVYVYAKK